MNKTHALALALAAFLVGGAALAAARHVEADGDTWLEHVSATGREHRHAEADDDRDDKNETDDDNETGDDANHTRRLNHGYYVSRAAHDDHDNVTAAAHSDLGKPAPDDMGDDNETEDDEAAENETHEPDFDPHEAPEGTRGAERSREGRAHHEDEDEEDDD